MPRLPHRAKVPGKDLRTPDPTIGCSLPPECAAEQAAYLRCRNGKLRLKQSMWCDALVADSFLLSLNALCRKYRTNAHTVRAIIRAYQDNGKFGSDSRLMARRSVERVLELTTDRLKQLLERNRIPAKVLSILWGIGHDKLAQLDAGIVPGTQRTQVEIDASATSAVLDVFNKIKALQGQPALPAPRGEGVNVRATPPE